MCSNKCDLINEVRNLKLKLMEQEEELNRLKQQLDHQRPRFETEKEKTVAEGVTLTNEEIARYSRQMIVPGMGKKGQIKLKKSSVLIVGAGGLGCPAALYLLGAGVGHIGLVDYDTVEISNLHRQLLHAEKSIGVAKVLSAANTLKTLRSDVSVSQYSILLDSSNALDIVSRFDVVIDATDNVATRYLLSDACVLTGRPLVSGSALLAEGQLTVYNHCSGPCYRCVFPEPPPPYAVSNCVDSGVIGPVPGVIGVLQALEAIKIITGIGDALSSRLLLFDALDTTIRTVKLRGRANDCAVCSSRPTVRQLINYQQFCGAAANDKDQKVSLLEKNERLTANQLNALRTENIAHVLIDVRSAAEFDICCLPDSFNIPITDLLKPSSVNTLLSAVAERKTDSQNKFQVYIICRRGNDSQIAVRQLQTALQNSNLMIQDIEGGLHSWAQMVDSDFPVY